MITQKWILSNGTSLACIKHIPKNNLTKSAVILISGFSHPMCDIDYFMSKLARNLTSLGFLVLQVDLRGHGDSSGMLEELTLDTLREDISTIIQYFSNTIDNIYCVSRGLGAYLISEYASKNTLIKALVGINPYMLNTDSIKTMWNNINKEIYDIYDIVKGTDYNNFSDFDIDRVEFFNALGADLLNLHGQKINGEFFEEFSNLDYSHFNIQKNRLWIFSNEDKKFSYINNFLPRNPQWQFNIIEKISKWLNEFI